MTVVHPSYANAASRAFSQISATCCFIFSTSSLFPRPSWYGICASNLETFLASFLLTKWQQTSRLKKWKERVRKYFCHDDNANDKTERWPITSSTGGRPHIWWRRQRIIFRTYLVSVTSTSFCCLRPMVKDFLLLNSAFVFFGFYEKLKMWKNLDGCCVFSSSLILTWPFFSSLCPLDWPLSTCSSLPSTHASLFTIDLFLYLLINSSVWIALINTGITLNSTRV